MIARIVEQSRSFGGKDGWASIHSHGNDRSQKAYLADEFIELTKQEHLKWVVSKSNQVAVATQDSWMIIISVNTHAGGRYMGGSISNYSLAILSSGTEVAHFKDRCDNPTYNTSHPRLPVMDLWDVACFGSPRKPSIAHVCGSQGFGQSLNDSCPACEAAV